MDLPGIGTRILRECERKADDRFRPWQGVEGGARKNKTCGVVGYPAKERHTSKEPPYPDMPLTHVQTANPWGFPDLRGVSLFNLFGKPPRKQNVWENVEKATIERVCSPKKNKKHKGCHLNEPRNLQEQWRRSAPKGVLLWVKASWGNGRLFF